MIEILKYTHKKLEYKNKLDVLIIILILLTPLDLPMVPLGLPMVPMVPTFPPMVTLAVTLKCEINLISRNQIDFAKSDLTEMRNQTKFMF